MDKKTISIIFVFLIIGSIFVGGFVFSQDTLKVGDATFTIPQGYKCAETGKYNNLTNDNGDSIILVNYNNSNIKNITDTYVNYNKEHNITIDISQTTIQNYTVYKSDMNTNSSIIHYWFIYENEVYEIFTQTANSNTENIVSELIGSVHSS